MRVGPSLVGQQGGGEGRQEREWEAVVGPFSKSKDHVQVQDRVGMVCNSNGMLQNVVAAHLASCIA